MELVYLDTDLRQIAVELSIIEGAQFHLNRRWSLYNPPWKPKERREPLPCGMGIRWRKITVTNPHHQVGERDFTYRHHLILAVIQLIHRSLPGIQILQCPEHLSFLLAVAFLFTELVVA